MRTTLAYFISPHGFGHAARACAVMEAWRRIEPDVHFEIFTTVPLWFFEDSLASGFTYHACRTDVGLVQRDALEVDFDKTISALEELYPLREDWVESLAAEVRAMKCEAVLCDIAPAGIAAARRAGLPSVLIENFTWDFIYRGYLAEEPRFKPFIDYLGALSSEPALRIQTEPICEPAENAVQTAPVSRALRKGRQRLREELGLSADEAVVLVTMGGVPMSFEFLERLKKTADTTFVVSGAVPGLKRDGNVIVFPPRSGLHHPDLVAAADVLVGKLGYSTVAEALQAGSAFVYVSRPGFVETPCLAGYLKDRLPCAEMSEADFRGGEWISEARALAARRRGGEGKAFGGGAKEAVRAVLAVLHRGADLLKSPA